MDTKLKSNRRIFWAVVLVAFCTLAMICCYPRAYDSVQERMDAQERMAAEEDSALQSWPNYSSDSRTDLSSFIRYLYMGSYGMYWELTQKQGEAIQLSDLYFPNYSSGTTEDETVEEELEYFNQTVPTWYGGFNSLMASYNVEYQMVDQNTGELMGNSSQNLQVYEQQEAPFFLKMSFDEKGNLEISSMQNMDGITLTVQEITGLSKLTFLYWMECYNLSTTAMQQPAGVDIYVYSANEGCYISNNSDAETETGYIFAYNYVINSETRTTYVVLLFLLAGCALLLPVFQKLRRENALLSRIPPEISLIGVIVVISAEQVAFTLCQNYVSDGGTFSLPGICFNILVYMLLFGAWFAAWMSLLQMRDVGVKRYWQERSFLYKNIDRILAWIRRQLRAFVNSLRTIDLSDRSDRWLLRLVAVNFLILFFCCMMWFWGVLGLLVYSVILFFILRKYLKQVKEKYGVLLRLTSHMAQGDLKMDVEEDLGPFEPLKQELAKVNSGFRKAVEEETRSQNMKTELITNVSHDLKTPLTAIITYVNLLKEENITPEERKSYVDILDRKSLRLKKLIEDLFEVSKAASGNIQIEKSCVNLGEMIRQAVTEQEDRMQEAGIECRVSVPEEPVLLMLDGEKTYRILENLLINVSKYGLAGTRAWVSLTAGEAVAEIVVKNISATELEDDCSYLTERFVRGDKARNTEGSGLGLAIVKSFTELQGGTFGITTDGDLFKAIVSFPVEKPKAGSKEEQ